MATFVVSAYPENEEIGNVEDLYRCFEFPDFPQTGDMFDIEGSFFEIDTRYHKEYGRRPTLMVAVKVDRVAWSLIEKDPRWKKNPEETLE